MTKGTAAFWLMVGLLLAFVDASLSLQAMFGLLTPRNPIQWAAAVILGLFLTVFVVVAEMRKMRKSALGAFVWLVIFAFDMATNALCAIWYGQLHHSFRSRIRLQELHYTPGNWVFTTIYVLTVIICLAGCIQLGRAFNTLLEDDGRPYRA
jgi:hypothetical protein